MVTYQDGDNTLDFALGAAQTTITSTAFTADNILNIGITANAVAQNIDSVITTGNETGTINVANAANAVTFEKGIGVTAARVKMLQIADNATTRFKSSVFALNLDVNTAAACSITTDSLILLANLL